MFQSDPADGWLGRCGGFHPRGFALLILVGLVRPADARMQPHCLRRPQAQFHSKHSTPCMGSVLYAYNPFSLKLSEEFPTGYTVSK